METEHYEEAIKRVRAYYPTDVFPDDVNGGKDEDSRRCRASAKMARLTCDNIRRVAEELAAEAEPE